MIRRWFVSYPRLLIACGQWLLSIVLLSAFLWYEPYGASYITQSSDILTPSWLQYSLNTVMQCFLLLFGWSGLLVIPMLCIGGCHVLHIVHVPLLHYASVFILIVANATWCAYVGYNPLCSGMSGGWVGYLCLHGVLSYIPPMYTEHVMRTTLAIAGVGAVPVRWPAYVVWYCRHLVSASVRSVIRIGRYGWHAITAVSRSTEPDRFTLIVREHIAREVEDADFDIFHDAFWHRYRNSDGSSSATSREKERIGVSDHDGRKKHHPAYESSYIEREIGGAKQKLRTGNLVSQTQIDSHIYTSSFVHSESQGIQGYEHTEGARSISQSRSISRPSKHLLSSGGDISNQPDATAHEQALQLEEKLATFGIRGSVTNITCGPLVTLFSYQPEQAVKVARITAREDDLRLALQAVSLRIIAPIPGTSVVGFEVSRPQPRSVMLRQLLEDTQFSDTRSYLPLALGTDTAGNPFVSDLAQMPHVLVAGSTGSGKSVALHSFLISLLYQCKPDYMQLILIDPKRLEFVAYQHLPHLATPVITEQKSVVKTFEWLVQEMERRYDVLAQAGVRNIAAYHERYGTAAMPYYVVVVDELADLMMGVGKDIEQYIARVAQMARAAGIHLIVATQRPSVDVVTGMIKVNFLSRIAFKVTSKVDSRTIIDQPGAEKLLGRGDMLHLDAKGVLHRLHGGFLTQEEIEAVIAHWHKQPAASGYAFDPKRDKQETASSSDDTLYDDVRAYVRTCETISISLIQRRFRIGYNRSARIVEDLEQEGIVSSADTNKMRKVLQ